MDDIDPPELAISGDWRGIMRRARKDHRVDGEEMTQPQLAAAVSKRIRERWPKSQLSASQVMISKIESGVTKSSKLVLPICDVLSLPSPEIFSNEDDRDWIRLGRLLRTGDLDEYKALVTMLEKLAKRAEDDQRDKQTSAEEEQSPEPPKSK